MKIGQMFAPFVQVIAFALAFFGFAVFGGPAPINFAPAAIAQETSNTLSLGRAQEEAAAAAAAAVQNATGAQSTPALTGEQAPLSYAPPGLPVPLPQAAFGEGNLKLNVRMAAGAPPLRAGVSWRVFGTTPDESGRLPLIASAKGGPTAFDLAPGSYLIHAAYGRTGATLRVRVGDIERFESIILDAGGLRLDGAVGASSESRQPDMRFDIYGKAFADSEQLKLIAKDVSSGQIVPLRAGTYHVISRYGSVNAVVRADVQVQVNQLTELTAFHKAAKLSFRLVTTEGGDAIANTRWHILTPGGDMVAESVGAVPDFVLAEGEYVAVANHNDNIYNRGFSVEAGLDRNVEVVALLSPSADRNALSERGVAAEPLN